MSTIWMASGNCSSARFQIRGAAVAEDDLSGGGDEAAPLRLAVGALGEGGRLRVGVAAGRALNGGVVADRPPSRQGRPSASHPSAVHAVASSTSRVLAEPSGCLPQRPATSIGRTCTPVPSSPRYIVGTGAGAVCSGRRPRSASPRRMSCWRPWPGWRSRPGSSSAVRLGVDQDEYVCRRGDLLHGPGDPFEEIVIDERSVVFTTAFANPRSKRFRSTPRPWATLRPEFGTGSSAVFVQVGDGFRGGRNFKETGKDRLQRGRRPPPGILWGLRPGHRGATLASSPRSKRNAPNCRFRSVAIYAAMPPTSRPGTRPPPTSSSSSTEDAIVLADPAPHARPTS